MEAVLDQPRVRIRPSDLVQRILMLDGKPFNLTDYPYLLPIYDTSALEVGLFTGRQIAKSTTLASKIVIEGVTSEQQLNQILVVPLQEQAYVFSTLRMRPFLHESPIIKQGFFSGENIVDQMLLKVLGNGNSIFLGYAMRTADRLRGKSAGKIYFDELQDIFPEVIPVVKEMAFRVKNSRYWYCGTPKSMGNHMEAMRRRSTAGEWAVKCENMGCGKWNISWIDKNIGNTGVVCEFCGKPINTNRGQWVQARKLDLQEGINAKVTMETYRIPQLIVKPVMDDPGKWRELLDKYRDYPAEQFANEVLGLPFDSGMQPITMDQLLRCCVKDRPNKLPDKKDHSLPPLVMGVDWAFVGENSFTFVTIGGFNPYPHKFEVYYWKIFKGTESDSLYQIDWIKRAFHQCGIRLIGADWGAGHVQNLQLVNALGEDRVAQMWHTGMNAAGSKAAPRAKFEPKTRKWHLARTMVLTDTFQTLRQARCTLPRAEDNELLFKHLLAESLEFRPESNRSFYTNVDPDDGLHSLTYAMLAGELMIRGNFGGHQGSDPVRPGAGNRHDRGQDWSSEDDIESSMY